MGQKVNPNGLRLGINRDWSSHWYADKHTFATYLDEDIKIRSYLEPLLNKIGAGLSHIDIERIKNNITISLFVSQPAIVLGKDNAQLKEISAKVSKILKKDPSTIKFTLVEIKNPDLDAETGAVPEAESLEGETAEAACRAKTAGIHLPIIKAVL